MKTNGAGMVLGGASLSCGIGGSGGFRSGGQVVCRCSSVLWPALFVAWLVQVRVGTEHRWLGQCGPVRRDAMEVAAGDEPSVCPGESLMAVISALSFV